MVKMIKFKFNCSNTVTVILFICYIHHSVIASSFPNAPHNVLASTFTNKASPKRRSFFETFKNSYTSIIPNKLREISIMNMLTGKRKNKKPSDDEELIYSDIINNPAIFTSMYAEKLAPQFQSIFSELDESYAKNPPPNLGSQLALKPNGLSFQPILDLTANNQPNQLNNQMTNNNNQINNQMNLQANNLQANNLHNQLNANKPTNQASITNSNANKLSNLLGQQSTRNQFSILFTGTQLNQPLQPNKLSDSSLAASSPYTKHFSSNALTSLGSSISSSLTSNLLNLKNKFTQQQKNANYFKNYKSYKDMMINPLNINQQINGQKHQLNNAAGSGAMLAAANQYNYFQQRPNQPLPVFQQQQSFNRYQMIQSPSTKKKCKSVQCPSSSKKRVVTQQFNGNTNFNNNNYNNNKMQDYESNLISNNVRQKQFYSMQQQQQEKQRPTFNSNTYSTKASGSGAFSQQKQNNFYKPVSDEKAGSQIKVGSDIITYDDIEQALRRNNLHKITNKDAQVYSQLHNLLMNTVQTNNGQFNNYQVDSKVNVEDNRSPRMFANKGKIFDDTYQQQTQLQQSSTKGWRPKITQQQQEFNQVKDTDLDQKLLFDEPQIKETDQQQKLTEEDDFSQITQQKEPVQQQVTNSQWQPVNKPTTKSPSGGVKTKSKSKSGTKTPNKKSPVKGVKSPTKLAKLQLASDSNSTDTTSDNSTTSAIDTSSLNTTASSVNDDLNREVEDTSGKLANFTTTTLITQSGPNGSMKIIKKIKRRKKKRITSDKSNDLQAVRKNPKGQAAKLVANSFEDQVKTDVSSEVESTTNSGQLIDTTTLNANTEVQFDDTTAVSDEQMDQKSKVTSTTVTLNTIPNKQEQVKGRMLAKKKKVMESIATTTQSSDSSIDSSPNNVNDESLETSLDEDKKINDQDTYFNENVTESNDNLDGDNLRSSRLKVKNSVRKKKLKSSTLSKNKPAHTSINSSLGDFTATFGEESDEPFRRIRTNKAQTNKQMDADESLENMHFRIDDVDADDYDNLNNKENENDGFSNGFSNEFDNSETRNQLNKLSLNGQPAVVDAGVGDANKQINQTLFNSLLQNNKLMNNTSLGSVQPIPHLVMMSMNAGNDSGDDESLDNMDVNQTIADLVQKINQANNGNLNLINEYRNYFTEDEFDLLTELLKSEANKTSTHLNLSTLNSTSTNLTKKDQVSTAESERKDLQSYYTDYDEKDPLKKFNSSSPIYLGNNGQASLKEYYYNNKEDIGKDVLINILNTKSKNPIPGQSKIMQVY